MKGGKWRERAGERVWEESTTLYYFTGEGIYIGSAAPKS